MDIESASEQPVAGGMAIASACQGGGSDADQERSDVKVEREILVTNKHGLHARPAMQLVELANQYQCDLRLIRPADPEQGLPEPTVADVKSVMAVITLAAVAGTKLHLQAEGEDAQEAADAISRLFEAKFGEE